MRFVIMGDSWALGNWDGDQGIVEYLRADQHQVRVMAEPGSSNINQVRHLREQIRKGEITPDQQIIWIVTDPLRDHTNEARGRRVQTLSEYHMEREQLLRQRFRDIQDLPVWLVGGVCALPDWVAQEFPRFRVICADWVRWLTKQPVPMGICRLYRYGDCDAELSRLFHEQEREMDRFRHRAEHDPHSGEHLWFWPDGEHPNRVAHRLLYDGVLKPAMAVDK